MRKCTVCGKQFEKYVPIESQYIEEPLKYGRQSCKSEMLNKEEYSCPYCYSPDRDRLIVSFLKLIHDRVKRGIDILEIAPSGAMERYLDKFWGECNRYTADLFMDDVDFNVDIQHMNDIAEESFDFIVCSHVLEHVKDDRLAISELNRVLRKNGLGIIIVPLDLLREETDEEWGLSEEENIRRFGQKDHVRAYSKADFVARLKEGGFGVHQLDKSFFGEQVFAENALTDTSTLYLVYKDLDKYKVREKVIEAYANELEPEINYWIDKCDVFEGKLRIWGWFYFLGHNSRSTKLKLRLKGQENYVFGLKVRKREDIVETFGEKYLYSGIDVLMDLSEIKHGKYSVEIDLYRGDDCRTIVASPKIRL